MEKKRLSKYNWYGSDVDSSGNPIPPEPAPYGKPLEGLNEGEIYIHNEPSKPSIYIRTTDGSVVPISGGGGGTVDDKKYLRKDMDDNTPYKLGVNALSIKGKDIANFVRYYDSSSIDDVVGTDIDVYSALMVDEKIKGSLGNFDDRYLRKDAEDTAHKHITFEEGIKVYELAEMLNLEVTELATIAQAVIPILRSPVFVDGFAGEGYQIWKDIATGDWNMTLDRLTVRKTFAVFELLIQKIRSVGGMIVVSAGNGKIKEVELVGNEYRISFEDVNTFAEGDLMRCQVFQGDSMKYYWVEVNRIEDGKAIVYASQFDESLPEVGDEVVLMGNTKNPLRQSMILISASEAVAQPVIDCYDGVKSRNFNGCLKVRVGNLNGISDSRFPADMQPQGHGLYANNCFLTGVFVLSTGEDVATKFAIMEGMIKAELSSIRSEINEKDNYLSNPSFNLGMDYWSYGFDVQTFTVSGKLLYFNKNLYSTKDMFAGLVDYQDREVLRIKKSYILQKNEDYKQHPVFKQYESDSGEMLYRPTMFFVTFKYKASKAGTLKVYFDGEHNDGTFESYSPLNEDVWIEASDEYVLKEIAGKWNGTGDLRISFTGDIYLYDLALASNALADLEERFSMELEITDKKIQANAEHIVQQGEKMEEYYGEFLFTAEQLQTTFDTKLTNTETRITEAYTSKITQTATSLTSEYKAYVDNREDNITESYTSLVTQTAKDLTAAFTADIDDVESGLKADYESKISASAQSLTSDYNAQITNLKNGDISTMKSQISQNASAIELRATTSTVNALTGRVTTAESNITTNANNISAVSAKIKTDSDGNITNISKSGLVLDSEFASMFSTQVTSQGIAKTASLSAYVLESELGTLVSKIEISADQIDLTGAVTFSDLSSSAQSTINGKADSSDLGDLAYQSYVYKVDLASSVQNWIEGIGTDAADNLAALEDSLGTLAYKSYVSSAMCDETLIVGGYIKTSLIDTSKLYVSGDNVTGLGDLAFASSVSISNVSGAGDLATYNNVLDAMEDETIIVGGYIKTSMIDVDDLVVKQLEAKEGSYTFSLDGNGYMVRYGSMSQPLVWLTADATNGPMMQIQNTDFSYWARIHPTKINIGSTSTSFVADTSEGLVRLNNMMINKFAVEVGSITTGFSVCSYTTLSMSGYPASSYKGRVLFIYFTQSCSVSGLAAGTVSCRYGTIFISNGSSWYHFTSKT